MPLSMNLTISGSVTMQQAVLVSLPIPKYSNLRYRFFRFDEAFNDKRDGLCCFRRVVTGRVALVVLAEVDADVKPNMLLVLCAGAFCAAQLHRSLTRAKRERILIAMALCIAKSPPFICAR